MRISGILKRSLLGIALFLAPLLHAGGPPRISAPFTVHGPYSTNTTGSGTVAFAQTEAGLVVAWNELRTDREQLFVAPLATPFSKIDTSRAVDVASDAVAPFGSVFVDSIAAGDGGYALTFRAPRNVSSWARVLDRDFRPIGTRHLIGNSTVGRVAWTGRDYAVAAGSILLIDPSGALRKRVSFPPEIVATAEAPGSSPLFVGIEYLPCFQLLCNSRATVHTVTLDETETPQKGARITDAGIPGTAYAVATSAKGSIIVWTGTAAFDFGVFATVFDSTGAIKKTVYVAPLPNSTVPLLNVAGDGDEWLILSHDQLIQLDGNGNILTPAQPVLSGLWFSPRLRRIGAGSYLLMYTEVANTIMTNLRAVRIDTTPERRRSVR